MPNLARGCGSVFVELLLAGCAGGLALAACGGSSPVSGPGSADGGGDLGTSSVPPSGDLGPGDGTSTYLNIQPPGSNGNSAGGIGLPIPGTPATYAQAKDRLWIMDVLRHFGRGELSRFFGPAPTFYEYDAALAVTAGYSEDEITRMVDQVSAKFGDLGALVLQDVDADVAGINAYIATLTGANSAKAPPEYALLKGGGFPPPAFSRNDVVASAILLQSIFAVGGGSEVTNEAFLQKLDPTVTGGNLNLPVAACQLWRDLRHANDPAATRTVSAAFQQSPATLNESCPQTLQAGTAIWDVGSYQVFDAYDANGVNQNQPPAPVTATARATLASLRGKDRPAPPVQANRHKPGKDQGKPPPVQTMGPYAMLHDAASAFGIPQSMSNWMAVTGANTVSGHPIGVMGPQVGYFQPHIIWEYAVHSTGGTPTDLDGRGMAVAGIPYVLIGRGTDYAWSATSNESDIVDTRVSKLCSVDGSTPSLKMVNGFPSADGYLYDLSDGKGPQCRRFYKRTDSWTASPTVASTASGGSLLPEPVHRYVLRTHYGPVFATATVNGAPVAISLQRSNFFGELDGAAMFALASTPTVRGASSFQHLFNGYTGTFNWLYVDKQDVGYIATGLLPVRDPRQSPELPAWGDGRFEWAGDRSFLQQNPDYFRSYGGAVPFPSRTVPVVQNGGPLNGGYLEWQDRAHGFQRPACPTHSLAKSTDVSAGDRDHQRTLV